MGAKSKRKGNNGERELCKLLTTILSGSFVRVPNSGAAVGGKNVARRELLSKGQDRSLRGDIIPPDHLPRLVIESKSYAEFSFHALLRPGSYPLLDAWIAEVMTAISPGDQWFVCFKISRRGWHIVVPEAESKDYVFDNYASYNGAHAAVRVTELPTFLLANRDTLLAKAGPE